MNMMMMLKVYLSLLLHISVALGESETLWGETIYNYYNQTAFIHLNYNTTNTSNDLLLPFYFNQVFTNGDDVSSDEIIEAPAANCKIVTNNNKLYAFYSNNDDEDEESNFMVISMYNSTSKSWSELDVKTPMEFYQGSSYLSTIDDTDSIYIFGGYIDGDNTDVSSRLLRFSISDLDFYNTTTSISPTGFYDASNLLINYNTQVVVGGKASEGWVSLKQLALWQYEAWAFQGVSVEADDSINSRKSPLLLPIFTYSGVNNVSDFGISSVLMIGGELSSTSYSSPNFAQLEISSSSWSWDSLDTSVSLMNSKTNNDLNEALSLDSIIGAVCIYDTLITISESTSASNSSSKSRRSNSLPSFNMSLYNSTNFENMDSIDYTSYITKASKEKSNKSLIIVLSTIIPLLFIIIVLIGGFILHKRYKKRQVELENEKDLKNIMEFYKTGSKNNNSSASSFGIKSEKANAQHLSANGSLLSSENVNHIDNDAYFDQMSHGTEADIKINDYEDGDNLSIGSWRRKRDMYEKQRRALFNLSPKRDTVKRDPEIGLIEDDSGLPNSNANNITVTSDEDISIPNRQTSQLRHSHTPSFMKRSLSTMSSTLRRNFSVQSSIKTFVTAETSLDNEQDQQVQGPQSPQMTNIPRFSKSKTGSIYQTFTIPEEEKSPSPPPPQPPQSPMLQNPNQLSVGANNLMSPFINGGESKSTLCLIPENGSMNEDFRKPHVAGDATHSILSESTYNQSSESLSKSNRGSKIIDPFDDEFIDPNFDVQVLVSSKRRSKLRIANPDPMVREKSTRRLNEESDDIVDMYDVSFDQIDRDTTEYNDKSGLDSPIRVKEEVRKRVISDENKQRGVENYE